MGTWPCYERFRPGDRRSQGSATVELAILLPGLLVLLFGIVEMGLLTGSAVTLRNAAREGCRAAAIGATVSEVRARVLAACASLGAAPTIQLQYRTFSPVTGTWSSWQTIGDTIEGGQAINSAPPGSQVRARLSYNHALIAAALLPSLGVNGVLPMTASLTMRRE